jgi:hypothetical protein
MPPDGVMLHPTNPKKNLLVPTLPNTPMHPLINNPPHTRRLPRLNKQRLPLRQHHTLFPLLHQRLQPPLHPRLASLNLGRLRPQHNNLPRHTRRLVINLQTRRDRYFIRQCGETAAREPLVQECGEQAAVHDTWVSAERGTEVLKRYEGATVRGAELQRRHRNLIWPEQRAAREVLGAQFLGYLEVRAGCYVFWVFEQRFDERVREEVVFDGGDGGVRGDEEGEGFFVGRGVGEVAHRGERGGAGHGEAGGEGEEREGEGYR